jgi:hypothetical protein
MKSVFTEEGSQGLIQRINQLNPETKANWGKMNVGQMLAHCNVTYELLFTDKHAKPEGVKKWMLKFFVKPIVVGDKPYTRNGRTAPVFLITDPKEFKTEKNRLIEHIEKVQELGEEHFDNKESHSFGILRKREWNNMFYKHLDHHLGQFGV